MQASGLSNVGKVRQNNEDNFFCSPENKLFVVADGLGGHSSGEVASEMTVSYLAENKPENIENLSKCINEANLLVYKKAREIKNDMATTISAMLICADKAFIGHVGDSRVYLIRNKEIYQITEDHTPVMESLRSGLITPEQARFHPMRHMLSRTIGTHPEVLVDSLILDIEAKDVFVLCTDGLSNLVEDQEILDIVIEQKKTLAITQTLVDKALERGGVDNVTVICIKVEKKDISDSAD